MAVRSLQLDARKSVTGRADPPTWIAATGLPWPSVFQRCLQLTSRFEGHGYSLIVGNFDGAGLTWGIVGFTLRHGEIQVLINEIDARSPELLAAAFGQEHAAELVARIRTQKLEAVMRWADSISAGSKGQLVAEPWRSGFATLGSQPLVQELQRRRAREKYFDAAVATAARLSLSEEQSIALCFDVHVQNGGVKRADEATYMKALHAPRRTSTERVRRELLARLAADSARAKYRDDVFARKNAIATGEGIVHGQFFNLAQWGFGIT
jgi:hypothetical protein